MKKLVLAALAAALVILPLASSCLAPRVDPLALFQPVSIAWPDVKDDLELGVADGVAKGDLPPVSAETLLGQASSMTAAIDARNLEALRAVPWPTLKPWAERGIDAQLAAGSIGPGVADTFRVHLFEFDEAVQRLRGARP